MGRRTLALILILFVVTIPAKAISPVELTAGSVKLLIDPARGGVPSGIWYDLNGDRTFSGDELIVDTAPDGGLIFEVVELPPGIDESRRERTILSSPLVAGRLPGPRESWYGGEAYRMTALADSLWKESESRAVVLGRFLWAGQWPYRLEWELTGDGVIRGSFQLLPGRLDPRPSQVPALGIDFRFHYRSAESFHRRAARAGVDKRIWELPAEVVRWWSGVRSYDRNPATYGYRSHAEIPWPDFNIVSLIQSGKTDCRLWKAVDWDTGNLSHWYGARSRGWLHVEDRLWGLGFGIADLSLQAPGSLTTDLDTGDLTAALKLRFWPTEVGRLDPRGADSEKLNAPKEFFMVPNSGRWNDALAVNLDRLGIPSGGITEVEPEPEKIKFSKPLDLPPVARKGQGAAFRIDEPAGIGRTAWPVTVGVPLRQGEFSSINELKLMGPDKKPVACQAEPLAYWPDKSVKWALVDAVVDLPAGKGAIYSLTEGGGSPAPGTKVTAAETSTGIRIETGPLALEIDRDGSGFIDRAWLDVNNDGRFAKDEMIVGDGGDRRSILDVVRSDRYRTGDHDIQGTLDESQVRIDELKIERSGPLRAVVLIRGRYLNRIELPFDLRLEAYAGKAWIKAQHTFTYTMNPDAEFIKAVGLKLPLLIGENRKIAFGGDKAPVVLEEKLGIGGLTQESPNRAMVWGAENSSGAVQELLEASRPSGWGDISNDRWGVTVAVQNFWQEFAKGVSIDKNLSTVAAWFWPPEAQPLDLRRYSRWMYPQVGETTNPWPGRGEWRNVGYATGLSKTSTAVFAFHSGPLVPDNAEKLAKGFQDRPLAVCNPDYYAEVGVAGPFAAYDDKTYPKLERTLTDICDWFIFSRQRFSWYGLIDYGDTGHMCMPAIRYDDDQPYVFRDGWAYDIGRWGWTNTEGQDALGYFMTFFHTGYRPYFDAGSITARHNQDIDIFHSGPLKYQGHTRHNVSHWGDGDFEIRISQPSPTRFYYYLTGDPRTKDVIEAVVDSLYLKYVVRGDTDLGAVLYGFLVRWEMTGDPVWRDRALGMAHAFGDCIGPDGTLPAGGFAIEPSTGRNLNSPRPNPVNLTPFFLHGFGCMHALVELEQLTGDKQLEDMLYKHAVFCAKVVQPNSYYWLALANALDRTHEKIFTDRILLNLSDTEYDQGIYARNRQLWTGSWANQKGNAKYMKEGGGWNVQGIQDIYTVHSGFAWSMMPSLFRAMKANGVKESQIPKKPVK